MNLKVFFTFSFYIIKSTSSENFVNNNIFNNKDFITDEIFIVSEKNTFLKKFYFNFKNQIKYNFLDIKDCFSIEINIKDCFSIKIRSLDQIPKHESAKKMQFKNLQ